MTLHLGPGLDLPDDVATEAMAILGQRGSGKSNALVVVAEELYRVGVPWVAIDPKGDWYGIRSAGDGTEPGLPVPVFGGLHGDIPLEPTAGRFMADLIFDQNLTCLLDVSTFSLGERARFLATFADRLYRRHHADPTVRHLLMEEAHLYLPQVVTVGEAQAVEAVSRMVLLGRTWGLGVTMASQRSARLNKNVLSQVGVLFALCTSGTQDRAAIKDWVAEHEVRAELVASLPALPPGTAWLWSPQVLHVVEQVTFRRRRTFDSASTPKVGQTRRAPATLADVDLAAVKEAMAETIAKIEADDPKALRRRIATLEADLAAARATAGLPHDLEALLVDSLTGIEYAHGQVSDYLGLLATSVETLRAAVRTSTSAHPRPAPHSEIPADLQRYIVSKGKVRTLLRVEPEPAADVADTQPAGPAWDALDKPERAILAVLAQHPSGRGRIQLALLSQYRLKSSTFTGALASLRARGLVEPGGGRDAPIMATDAGHALAATAAIEPLPTGPALYQYWAGRLKLSEQRILDVFVAAYPAEVARLAVAERSGYSPTSSTFTGALAQLRSLQLVDGWSAARELMEAIA